MKSIYTYYKERLIEISGKNRSLYTKSFTKKNGYDIGKLFEKNADKTAEFLDMLLAGKSVNFPLIDKTTKLTLTKNLGLDKEIEEVDEKYKQRKERQKNNILKRALQTEVQNLKALKREIDEIEKETGRYELFIAYPFVFGSVKNVTFKAPLLLFPAVIEIVNENNVNISLKYGENVQLNRALILAYAEAMKLNIEDLEMEWDSIGTRFNNLQKLLDYLKNFGIRFQYSSRKSLFSFNRYPEPKLKDTPEIKNLCLLSRYSLANSIYADYSALEKKHLTNDSINELLNTKKSKAHKKQKNKNSNLYLISNLDYAQEQVVKKVNENGNMVIYGPPGTGKSQTIVNIIADSLCKNKKVLVVSQKKAALEVVNNRLGSLNSKAMFITDAQKEKRYFYERALNTHNQIISSSSVQPFEKFESVNNEINLQIDKLNELSNCLNSKSEFGLSLEEMYYNSYKLGKNSFDYTIYKELIKDKKLLDLNYEELSSALLVLKEKDKADQYFTFVENKKKNPFINHLNPDLSVHALSQAQSKLAGLIKKREALFDVGKYKYSRQVLTYYSEVKKQGDITPLIKLVTKLEHPKADKMLKTSILLFPLYPFAKHNMNKKEAEVKKDFNNTLNAIGEYVKDYDFLKEVLSEDGYLMALDSILNGNNTILRLLLSALENYIEFRDFNQSLKNLTDNQKLVLNFAYKNSSTFTKYKETLNILLPVRIYIEIVKQEEEQKHNLSRILDFENIRTRIVNLKAEQSDVCKSIAENSFKEEYKKLFETSKNSKDFLYQISKKQNFWPIRKTMEVYGEFLFNLFPCWLLSPENVSTLLPLIKDMFDVVLFDEASQVFIENTLPSIFRGKTIVVAGDAKQLRPTTTFMKRYMGGDIDENLSLSTQAALEVESLLDLAVSRFDSANITYHYRSKNAELIDFSNKAFYNNSLQISPNVSKNLKQKPIERILVNGKWLDRSNETEAKQVIELTKQILKTRKNNETIGIITFNAEQETLIEDLFDKECGNNPEFRSLYIKETSRIEDGEDKSIFVKNLENVQGDERDIIIFSVGYAINENGKIVSNFGPLSNEGGENRLNVAITRAKQKTYVITSIEPEMLKVEQSKFVGPKLFRSYLTYVRAVSNGNAEEVNTILNSLVETPNKKDNLIFVQPIEKQIAERLNKLGYKTEINLGNSNSKISVAIYNRKKDRYILGIETDKDVLSTSSSIIERDVFRREFLEGKGWKLIRVFSRDFWHNPTQVINNIVKQLEK